MRRGLAFSGEVGSQNDLLYRAVQRPVKQLAQANVTRTHTVKRADLAHQHKIQPSERTGTLQRRLICRGFHHAQFAGVAPWVLADVAQRVFSERVAALAVHNLLRCVTERRGQAHGRRAVVLQQMKSHTLRRLDAHTRQAAQRLNQCLQRVCTHRQVTPRACKEITCAF